MRVSRFKSAELLQPADGGTGVRRARARSTSQPRFTEATTGALVDRHARARDRVAHGQRSKGGAVMLHQGARKGEIALPKETPRLRRTAGAADAVAGGGDPSGGSAYGGGGSCDGVVQAELTHIDATRRAG